jgi:hypothetical protein
VVGFGFGFGLGLAVFVEGFPVVGPAVGMGGTYTPLVG